MLKKYNLKYCESIRSYQTTRDTPNLKYRHYFDIDKKALFKFKEFAFCKKTYRKECEASDYAGIQVKEYEDGSYETYLFSLIRDERDNVYDNGINIPVVLTKEEIQELIDEASNAEVYMFLTGEDIIREKIKTLENIQLDDYEQLY